MSEPATQAGRGVPAATSERKDALPVLAAVMRRVDLDALARNMVDAYRQQIDAYARLPEPILYGRKLARARANLDLFVSLAGEQRDITDADIEPHRAAARLDVDDAIPLESVLQAYQIGGALAWRTIAAAATAEEHATGLLAATHLYVSFSERASAAVCEVYAAELERMDAGTNRVALAAYDALVHATVGEDELARRAERANLALAATYTPFAARSAAGSNLELARMLRAADVFVVQNAGEVVGFVQSPDDERALARNDAAFALAPDTPAGDLGAAFDSIRQLVELAARAGLRRRIDGREFLLERSLLASTPLADTLARAVVGPLSAQDRANGSAFVSTLEAFLACGMKRKAAAELLHVHPNTLDSRMGRIGVLTGLDLTRPGDLALAIVAMSLHAMGRSGDAP